MSGREILETVFLAFCLLVTLQWWRAWLSGRRMEREARARLAQRWALPAEQVRAGFDRVRNGVPVDDEELSRARPIQARRKR